MDGMWYDFMFRQIVRYIDLNSQYRGLRLAVIFGYTHLTGGYPGNQAEYCRVPNTDIVLVKAPEENVIPEKPLAFVDVTTTAWHG